MSKLPRSHNIVIKATIPYEGLRSERVRDALFEKLNKCLGDYNIEVTEIRSEEIMAPDPLHAPLDGTAE